MPTHGTQVRGAITPKLPHVGDRVRFVPTSTDRTRILQVFPGTGP
jgi:hypothetical protein